jgi:hypothetical protein
MTVYLMRDTAQGADRYYMTADIADEARAFAESIQLPAGRLFLAEGPRWHYRFDPDTWELATYLVRGNEDSITVADLATFRRLVAARQGKPAREPAVPEQQCAHQNDQAAPRRVARFDPHHPRHAWIRDREHWRHCLRSGCGLVQETVPGDNVRWWRRWWFPSTPQDQPLDDRDGMPMPRCRGPRPGRSNDHKPDT